MCRDTVDCGAVPGGLLMKLAVNIFLITTVTGLAEAFRFAARHGLDLEVLRRIADGGQMASDISRVKTPMLVTQDFPVQAALRDVLDNNELISSAAREAGIAVPLLEICHALYAEAVDQGHGGLDMAGVLRAIEARTATIPHR